MVCSPWDLKELETTERLSTVSFFKKKFITLSFRAVLGL